MPISSSVISIEKKKQTRTQNKTTKTALSVDTASGKGSGQKNFLTIGPALPSPVSESPKQQPRLLKRSLSTLSSLNSCLNYDEDSTLPATVQNYSDGTVHVLRSQKAKEKNPDRVCLNRKGFSVVPIIDGEPQLRLLSLQHNLLSTLDGLQEQKLIFLVFLDLYDNQLEKISSLDTLESLRVLLMGKNRIKRIDGLQNLIKLEVLDLHGNKISQVSGLSKLSDLKVLNLAGNQIKNVGMTDLKGLISLQELNLRRNKLKKLLGFGETLQLQKLFLSNNDIQNVEDISSVAKAVNLREVAIDNNPISLAGEYASFLVSYLSRLILLNNMQITDQVRKAAMAWRKNKESSNAAFMDLKTDVCLNIHREEIISNARTNWELLRSQTKCITTKSTVLKDFKIDKDFVLTPEIKNPSIRKQSIDKRINNSKISVLPDKKLSIIRTSSQDTENSQNTSSSNELFRLPPILVPIINKLEKNENSTNNGSSLKRCGSLSSIGPNIDSSSFPSNSSSSSSEAEEKECVVVEKNQTATDTSSTLSTISVTTAQSSSASGSELSNTNSCRTQCTKRSIKSAISIRSSSSKIAGRAATAKPKRELSLSPSLIPTVNKDREQGGDYLIEITGRSLNIYGLGALRFIDKPWNSSKANDVTTAKFSYINFNNIVGIFGKLKNRFPNINNLVFYETNIFCLGQLNAFAEVQGFTSLTIEEEGNPIFKKKWRSYAVYRLSHWGIKCINGKEISENELKDANEEYQALSDLVLWSLPDVLLQPLLARLHVNIGVDENINAKQWLYTADPELKSVVSKEALQWNRGAVSQEDLALRQRARVHIGSMLDALCETVQKLRYLDNEWPHILNDILKDILADYSQIDIYMKKKLNELK